VLLVVLRENNTTRIQLSKWGARASILETFIDDRFNKIIYVYLNVRYGINCFDTSLYTELSDVFKCRTHLSLLCARYYYYYYYYYFEGVKIRERNLPKKIVLRQQADITELNGRWEQ